VSREVRLGAKCKSDRVISLELNSFGVHYLRIHRPKLRSPMPKYLSVFPKPLLDDLVAGRWLPMVGAGFSRNAIIPPSKKMPLWDGLGSSLEDDLTHYSPSGTLDAISEFEHQYGRPKLIERLAELLLVNEATPGAAHRALCSLPFDLICTTNFDFLLERQYQAISRHCTPVIDEDQLSVTPKEPGVALFKLHGDLHHPGRLVATESDYDGFLDRYPLLSTFLANLLITRTAVLIGYSLDDPDFRQVWHVVRERLGRSRRIAYAILVSASSTDVSRFERRGVKVVNLSGPKSKYGEILAEAFSELHMYWRTHLIPASKVKEEQPLQELSLPPDAQSRLCFLAVPLSLQPFYRERVFPIIKDAGFVPVTADDIISPGDMFLPKIDALLDRTLLFLADVSAPTALFELEVASSKLDPSRILVIANATMIPPHDERGMYFLMRPDLMSADPEGFLDSIRLWFTEAAERFAPSLASEPLRLLNAQEYNAAVITAVTLLETTLRDRLNVPASTSRRRALRELLDEADKLALLGKVQVPQILEWLRTRNEIVHGGAIVTKPTATHILSGVMAVVRSLRAGSQSQ
jgi:hypothetical protein